MEADVVTMQDIFKFEQTGIEADGRVIGGLEPTGIRPTFADRLGKAGVPLDLEGIGGTDGVGG